MVFLAYLNGTSSNMTIVRETSSEGRTIVEGVQGFTLCELKLLFEGINFLPVFQYFFFFFREVGSLRD